LRQQIREQIQAGKTDSEIRTYMVERYGDFVLYRPPLKTTTVLLWFGPLLLLVFGLLILAITLKRRRSALADKVLSADDLELAQALFGQINDRGKQPCMLHLLRSLPYCLHGSRYGSDVFFGVESGMTRRSSITPSIPRYCATSC